MPELPEMETYRKLLDKKILGKTITDVEINREKSINIPSLEFVQEVKGKQITKIERGWNLLWGKAQADCDSRFSW